MNLTQRSRQLPYLARFLQSQSIFSCLLHRPWVDFKPLATSQGLFLSACGEAGMALVQALAVLHQKGFAKHRSGL
ncbi:hypothetical protein DBR47_19250 [Paucibacter sp. KBW04]|uniref:hypothetical protein n=1 Tax=Paucibacter sp. KBW04 TaxID=2153361 RepID=UPI000FABD4B7|nr:hypothetical protein [Paucibacter sp. KBW04]RQO55998.1 hypothetical protein DBR47_19250 [Paucibacter sp. KBW04]